MNGKPCAHENSGAEKTDPGNDLGSNPGRLPSHTGEWCQQDKKRRTNRDKRIRPQPSSPLAPLTFGADDRAEHQRASQAYHELKPRKMRTGHMRGECV